MLRRKAESKLLKWKSRADRKPLLVRGVRQCGKTHLLRHASMGMFENVAYVNLENDPAARADFLSGLDPRRIVTSLVARTGQRIVPGKTLIVIDEVQACEEALTSLKYFSEDAPQYHVAAAGSLLGVAINRDSWSFPVGKAEVLDMVPLDFEEYLWARGKDDLAQSIRMAFDSMSPLAPSLHEEALGLYREYMVVGGMPEAVQTFVSTGSVIDVAEKHRIILDGYSADTNKYASAELSAKTRACFDSIPAQLAKENRKFQYKVVRRGGSASLFGDALDWLALSGTIRRCTRVSQIESPLEAFVDMPNFKIYLCDTGLLVSKSGAQRADILNGLGSTFMGAVAENSVAQALAANGYSLHYWTHDNRSEIDFVVERQGCLSAVEVKWGENTRARSLASLRANRSVDRLVRISAKPFGNAGGMTSVPLYAAHCL
ncbi:MAG: ATP-binding protein [Atopobiaceae bacterium]|nr:ATP-binding protein [Atopobiaceae bacterium]